MSMKRPRDGFHMNYHSDDRLNQTYLKGFYTGRHLQWTLGAASIPYSLAHVDGEGWLVGDESGNIWSRSDGEEFENILEFESGISEIAPLDRFKVLIGEMRGSVTQLDLNHLTEETIKQISDVQHRAPIKCIKWQPEQSNVFATAGQDGSVMMADLRCSSSLIGNMNGCHQLNATNSKSRSTMTGLVYHPLRPELFYTTGTPDTCIRLWDMRKMSNNSNNNNINSTRNRRSKSNSLSPVEEFSTFTRKHRSSVALTIDSIGSRLFLASSNDSIFEFLTSNCDIGPVASYTAEGFNSCSFFSNISIDPTDKYLLSGSSNGQAYIWDTTGSSSLAAFELPVCAQLEVSKTAWATGTKGSLNSQIACISDDLSFSLFNWNLFEDEIAQENHSTIKRPKELASSGKEQIYLGDCGNENLLNGSVSGQASIPITPSRKRPPTNNFISTPPTANKSILDFFNSSPRQLFK